MHLPKQYYFVLPVLNFILIDAHCMYLCVCACFYSALSLSCNILTFYCWKYYRFPPFTLSTRLAPPQTWTSASHIHVWKYFLVLNFFKAKLIFFFLLWKWKEKSGQLPLRPFFLSEDCWSPFSLSFIRLSNYTFPSTLHCKFDTLIL